MPDSLHWFWRRIEISFQHRAWNTDLLAAVAMIASGMFLFFHPNMLEKTAFDFVDPMNLYCLIPAMIFFGLIQFLWAIINVVPVRRILAALGAVHWTAWGIGVYQHDPNALAAVMFGTMTLANLLTLWRA